MTNARAELGAQLALDRARAAARDGDLLRAAQLLDELDSSSVAALDLQARVHAQLGEREEADRCWARVQEQVPDDPAAERGRRALARGSNSGARLALVAAVVVAGTAVVGGGTWLGLAGGNGEPAPDRLLEQTRRADELQRRLTVLEAQRTAADARNTAELDAIAHRLAMPGVLVHRRAGDVEIVFESGIFPRDVEIGPAGAPLLAEIGRRLAELPATTTVVGHTATVPGGRTSGGSMTGLARAQAVAARLAAGSGLPLTSFRLAAADQAAGPFPDAARNRTVTLEVVPRPAG